MLKSAKDKMKTETTNKLIEHVTSECSAIDQERIYDAMLDEVTECCPLCSRYGASRILKEIDPVAYRCGKNDYFGTTDEYFEIGSELYERREVEKARDEFIDELDSQIIDLESEIEDMEADEDHNVSDLAALKQKLNELQAAVTEAQQYTF